MGKEKLLSEFKIGESGVIRIVNGEGALRRRLFDMGVTPGADVYLRRKAPFGDPLEITIRGYELTLRKTEAACVVMTVGGDAK
jgi:Fe2+ transport system protein FeoA